MNIDDLVTYFRQQVQDELTDTSGSDTYALFKDDEVLQYAYEAQNEFCHLVDTLADASTPEVVEVAVTASDPWVDLHPSITNVRRARLDTGKYKLQIKSHEEMEHSLENDYGSLLGARPWETQTGRPRVLVLDLEPNRGRLTPIPSVDDTILLYVYRLPICDVRSGADLEIAEEHRQQLVMWMKHLAYRKADSEIQDEQLADLYQQRFIEYCRQADTRQKLRGKRQYNVRTNQDYC